MKLRVRQFDTTVGYLESTAGRGVNFVYGAEHLSRPGAQALSLSLPLRRADYPQSRAMPFFEGLLPDGDLKRRIAERLPLTFPRRGARLSLAEAEDKVPLRRRMAGGSCPSQALHRPILKPASAAFPQTAANEFASTPPASLLGLPVLRVELALIGKPVLIVDRHDRRVCAAPVRDIEHRLDRIGSRRSRRVCPGSIREACARSRTGGQACRGRPGVPGTRSMSLASLLLTWLSSTA